MTHEVALLRRLFQLFALVALVLGGTAEAMRAPVLPVHLSCACGCPETPEPVCPCGMPKTPSGPQAPVTTAPKAVLVLASQAADQAVQAQADTRPTPMFVRLLGVSPEATGFQATSGLQSHAASPPDRSLDRLARLAVFRI